MNTPQVIILPRLDIQEQINNCTLYGPRYMCNIKCNKIRSNIKYYWRDIKLSEPDTYIFLGEESETKLLFGLYKSDKKVVYIVKSFLDTILVVVPFSRKYFED